MRDMHSGSEGVYSGSEALVLGHSALRGDKSELSVSAHPELGTDPSSPALVHKRTEPQL